MRPAFILHSLEPRFFLSGSPLSSIPALHSLPSASAKLYLDFDGDPPSTFFYQPVPATPAYDRDGDATTFSAGELADLQLIWQRLAEKFSPFKLDVTTVDPGNLNDHQTFRLVIGGDGAWAPATEAGVSQPGGFAMSGSSDNTAYVFPSRLGYDVAAVGEVAAHEAGHGFGLVHSTVAGTTLRAPIMGTTLGSEQRRTWYNGPTPYGVNQDDLAVIADTTTAGNGFGYRVDDVGDTLANASPLTLSGNTASASGVISKTSDRDYFSFTASSSGTVSINASVAPYGAMLDLKLELRDAANNLLASADTATLGESLSFALPSAGTYYLVVASHGSYGDVGQYTLNATLPSASAPAPVANLGGPYSVGEGASLTLSASASTGSNLTYAWDLDGDGIYGESGAAATRGNESGLTPTFNAAGLDGPSTFNIALRVTDDQNRTSTANGVININNLAPVLDAGPDGQLGVGVIVPFTGSLRDPGGDPVSGTVNYGDGSGLFPISFDGNGKPILTRAYSVPGIYVVSITVSDGLASASDNVVMTVADIAGVSAANGSSYLLAGVSGAKTFTVYGGSVTFSSDALAVDSNLTLTVQRGAEARFGSTQHLAALSVVGSAVVLSGGGRKAIITKSLSVSGAGQLDLHDNDLVLDYSLVSPVGTWTGNAYDGIAGLVASGRNGGSWNGRGIISSMAGGPYAGLTTPGVGDASQVLHILGLQTANFDGQIVDASSVIVRYTYLGDATLDGKINIDDYIAIDGGIQHALTGWSNGDFNYDGKINIDDYTLMDAATSVLDSLL